MYFHCFIHGINNFSKKSQLFLVENGIYNPIYVCTVCTHDFPVPVIGHSLGCVHVRVHASVCVYPAPQYRSGSDITKCWIVPNTCECLSQHIQTLTPTPGNPFINTPTYPAWALILYSGTHPCLHILLVPLSLKQIWPTSMHGYSPLLS